MLRSDRDCTTGNKTLSVPATKDNEEIKLEGNGDFGQDRVMTKAIAESHPVVEYSGSVRLSSRHDTTLGCF